MCQRAKGTVLFGTFCRENKIATGRLRVRDIEEIIRYFPNSIYTLLKNTLSQDKKLQQDLQEIRIRVERAILLKTRQADIVIDYQVSNTEILQTLEKLCENSIYAYKNQICEGFLTVRGGHRVGIAGTAVTEERKNYKFEIYNKLKF